VVDICWRIRVRDLWLVACAVVIASRAFTRAVLGEVVVVCSILRRGCGRRRGVVSRGWLRSVCRRGHCAALIKGKGIVM
jgi:hypothetical protein